VGEQRCFFRMSVTTASRSSDCSDDQLRPNESPPKRDDVGVHVEDRLAQRAVMTRLADATNQCSHSVSPSLQLEQRSSVVLALTGDGGRGGHGRRNPRGAMPNTDATAEQGKDVPRDLLAMSRGA